MEWGKWEDPDEAGDIEPLKSDESSLPVERATLPPSEKINPALPERVVMASPEVAALPNTADSS